MSAAGANAFTSKNKRGTSKPCDSFDRVESAEDSADRSFSCCNGEIELAFTF